MKIYAISDTHLSFSTPFQPDDLAGIVTHKPMEVCNQAWENHYIHIFNNWHQVVGKNDLVLVPGDISWALKLEEAVYDLDFLGMLPGTIVAVQGNHDYWWQSISKVRQAIPSNMRVIQNDHIIIEDIAFCGTRGWACPNNGGGFDDHDEKIYKREIIRLENSLQSIDEPVNEIIVLMHYMPTNEKHERSGFIDVLEKYGVKTVIYGHLHSRAQSYRLPDSAWGINFHLASADYVNFTPILIKDTQLK